MYKIGDKVVYPHHGAGTVIKKEKREILGQTREYLTIQILHNDMTVNVPAENAERVGLRKVIDEEAVAKVVKYLTSGGTEMPKNWNRRFKHNRDKMKTGDIYELAEVVRNLALRDGEKGLSTGEKQMYVKAKKILASELMYAKNLSEDDAIAWLEDVLTGPERKPAPAKRHAATQKPAAALALAGTTLFVVATAFFSGVAGFGFAPSVSVSSSHSSASSSVMVFAYISSDARIFFALTYICFSPVERPFSTSRSARFRTTSASS